MHLNKRCLDGTKTRDVWMELKQETTESISKYKSPMVTPAVDSEDAVSARPVRLRGIVIHGHMTKTEEKGLDATCFWRSWKICIPGRNQQGADGEC